MVSSGLGSGEIFEICVFEIEYRLSVFFINRFLKYGEVKIFVFVLWVMFVLLMF